eukprot:6749831-Prorocentrum_lima.AAC.1
MFGVGGALAAVVVRMWWVGMGWRVPRGHVWDGCALRRSMTASEMLTAFVEAWLYGCKVAA